VRFAALALGDKYRVVVPWYRTTPHYARPTGLTAPRSGVNLALFDGPCTTKISGRAFRDIPAAALTLMAR
jgi:hypothetical protein